MDEGHSKIPIAKEVDLFRSIHIGKQLSNKIGFNTVDQNIIATALSELGTNILRYAKQGEILIRIVHNGLDDVGIEIIAQDHGPGIENINEALQDHFSTKGSLGLGLPSLKRMMDEFRIESTIGMGTKITLKKWKKQYGNH